MAADRGWSWFCPSPQMLENGEGDHRHERAMVQASPAPVLEVVEPEFLLHLLVRLFAYPAALDQRRQVLQRDIVSVIARGALALAGHAALAQQPDIFAAQATVARDHRTMGHPDKKRGKVGLEIAFGATPPREGTPVLVWQGGNRSLGALASE
jgi:hypothetical protein